MSKVAVKKKIEAVVEDKAGLFDDVKGYDDIVMLRDIEVESHCEHHMAPFLGKAYVAYIPQEKVVGISKLARVVEIFARRLQTLATRFDPDWSLPFTRVFGDILGVQVANAIAGALRHAKDAAGAFASNAAEYVTEESRDVVPRAELDAFHDDVDELRDQVERLAARVARLPGNAE